MSEYEHTYEAERPTLDILTYINPADFGPRHLELLKRLEEFAWDGTTHIDFAKRIALQDVWLWEVGTDARPIVLLSITESGGERVLFIEGVAGDGVLANSGAIVSDLHKIATFYRCSKLRATSEREGFHSLPEQFNFRPVATVWEQEVPHGRVAEQHDLDAEG